MTSAVPWSVKGIDPKARETAKDLARRSGMTLGEWLNQIIEDHGELSGGSRSASAAAGGSSSITEALERLSARIEAAEARSTLAISGIDQSVRGVVSRIAEGEREQTAIAARFEGGLEEITGSQVRLAERLRRLEDEAAGPRSIEAVRALEISLGKVAAHVYEGESETRGAVVQVRDEMASIAARLLAVETGPDHMVDAVVARIAERLEQAEGRTRAAMRGLEASFSHLDQRLVDAEHRLDSGAAPGVPEHGLEQLAHSLSLSVEDARSEMAEKLLATTDGRFDRMETVLEEMSQHVRAAERHSAHAIERMGHEVLRLAESLNRRVQGVEHRSAEAIAQVGGDVARIADKLDTRLHHADGIQAEALEKLGAEIARITERLADRISSAERRSAQAIDEVGEQVVRVTERLNQRYDRSSSDLAERIRQSEERTAHLLEDARERLDQRLGLAPAAAETVAEAEERSGPAPQPDAYPDPYAPASRAVYASAASIPPPAVYAHAAPFGQASAPQTFAPSGFVHADPDPDPDPEAEPEQSLESAAGLDLSDLDAADDVLAASGDDAHFNDLDFPSLAEIDPLSDALSDDPFGLADDSFAPAPARAEPPPPQLNPHTLSTREVLEQARSAARAAAQEKDGKTGKPRSDHESGSELFPNLTFGSKRRKAGSGYRKALMMTAAAICFGAAGYGYFILKPQVGAARPEILDAEPSPGLGITVGDAGAQPQLPRAALLLDPQPIAPVLASAPPAAPTASAQLSRAELEGLYNQAIRLLEAKDRAGLEPLRRAANLGFAPAQFALGKAYEDGQSGLPKDFAQARRWTERAAAAGNPQAMHNLAHYHYNGDGGPRNPTLAIDWFRRAANLGYSDSQYNLGVIYEQGVVTPRNEAEAYKWYLLATRGGGEADRAQARTAVLRVGPQLSIEARVAAERIAAAFTAQAPYPSVQVARGADAQ